MEFGTEKPVDVFRFAVPIPSVTNPEICELLSLHTKIQQNVQEILSQTLEMVFENILKLPKVIPNATGKFTSLESINFRACVEIRLFHFHPYLDGIKHA